MDIHRGLVTTQGPLENIRVMIGFVLGLALMVVRADAIHSAPWRIERNCGPNCAYMLLRTTGRTAPDYLSVIGKLRVTERGTTLKNLANYLIHQGLPVDTVRLGAGQLDSIPLPAIAHTEPEGNGSGHFIVLLSIGTDEIEYIDGTTVAIHRERTSDFLRQWTGYLIRIRDPAGLPNLALAGFAACMIATTLILLIFGPRMLRSHLANMARKRLGP